MTLHHSWYAAPLVAACMLCLALLVRLDWTPSVLDVITVESLHIQAAGLHRIILAGATTDAGPVSLAGQPGLCTRVPVIPVGWSLDPVTRIPVSPTRQCISAQQCRSPVDAATLTHITCNGHVSLTRLGYLAPDSSTGECASVTVACTGRGHVVGGLRYHEVWLQPDGSAMAVITCDFNITVTGQCIVADVTRTAMPVEPSAFTVCPVQVMPTWAISTMTVGQLTVVIVKWHPPSVNFTLQWWHHDMIMAQGAIIVGICDSAVRMTLRGTMSVANVSCPGNLVIFIHSRAAPSLGALIGAADGNADCLDAVWATNQLQLTLPTVMLTAAGVQLAYDIWGALLDETVVYDTAGVPRVLVPANTTLGVLHSTQWTLVCATCVLRQARSTDVPASLCYNLTGQAMYTNVTAPIFRTNVTRSINQYRVPWLPAVAVSLSATTGMVMAHMPIVSSNITAVACNGTQFYTVAATETTCMPTATLDRTNASMMRIWRNASHVAPPVVGTCGNLTVYAQTDGSLVVGHTGDPCFPVLPGYTVTCRSYQRCMSIAPSIATDHVMIANLMQSTILPARTVYYSDVACGV